MPAQLGSGVALNYGPQGSQQLGSSVLLETIVVATSRRLVGSTSAPWATSAHRMAAVHAAFNPSSERLLVKRAPWGVSSAKDRFETGRWAISRATDDRAVAPWLIYTGRGEQVERAAWSISIPIDDGAGAPWGSYDGVAEPRSVGPWGTAAPIDDRANAPWTGPMLAARMRQQAAFAASAPIDRRQEAPWNRFSRQMAPGWGVVIPVHDPSTGEEALIVVPVQRAYMQTNTVNLRRVVGNLVLPAKRFGLKLDRGSWVWNFDATLPGYALPDVEPVGDVPVEVEATVNGMAFRFVVEGIGRDRTFGKADIRITGRGKAALLDDPYEDNLSFSNINPRNAAQLADEALAATEYGATWTLGWQAVDWLVPGGVWSHQGSPISALNTIAAAAGSYIQPHPSSLLIDVLPQYPVPPWEWDTVAPDFELPADVVTREGIDWATKTRYNRVYVSGVQTGVNGRVTRAGSAGDVVAQMVMDPLITVAAAARQRGIPVLADTGRIADVTLRLPVLSLTGVILPGKFVRYVDGSVTRFGIVRSTAVEAQMPNVWQTIGVETHVD